MKKTKKADYGYLREALMVRRYHTIGHVAKEDTVGHHTCNVIAMIFFMCNDNPPLALVKKALHHDVPELGTGDMPATTKWENPALVKELEIVERTIQERHNLATEILTEEEEALLKFADYMDLCFKAVEEIGTGNQIFGGVLMNGLGALKPLMNGPLKHHEGAQELFTILQGNPFIQLEIKSGAIIQPIIH